MTHARRVAEASTSSGLKQRQLNQTRKNCYWLGPNNQYELMKLVIIINLSLLDKVYKIQCWTTLTLGGLQVQSPQQPAVLPGSPQSGRHSLRAPEHDGDHGDNDNGRYAIWTLKRYWPQKMVWNFKFISLLLPLLWIICCDTFYRICVYLLLCDKNVSFSHILGQPCNSGLDRMCCSVAKVCSNLIEVNPVANFGKLYMVFWYKHFARVHAW